MSDRLLYIHMGAPKCGSTFLQRVLAKNGAVLAAKGVIYPASPDDHPGNGLHVLNSGRKRLEQLFEKGHIVIISHEDIFSNTHFAHTLRENVPEDIEIHLSFFLKPINEIVFGMYSQYMKQFYYEYHKKGSSYDGRGFEEIAVDLCRGFRFVPRLHEWREAVQPEAFRVLPVKSMKAEIQRLVGEVELDWNIDSSLVNISLFTDDCERIAAHIASGSSTPVSVRQMIDKAMQRSLESTSRDDDPGRSPERIAWIRALSREERGALRRDFGLALDC
jgi:hypothetical protein